MPRSGYTNLGPAHRRTQLFAALAERWGLDAHSHADRLQIIDRALQIAAEGRIVLWKHICPSNQSELWCETGQKCPYCGAEIAPSPSSLAQRPG